MLEDTNSLDGALIENFLSYVESNYVLSIYYFNKDIK